MKKIGLLFYTCLLSLPVFSAGNDSIYVTQLKAYISVVSYRVAGDDTINRVLSYHGLQFRYGKWQIFYEQGQLKAQGYFSVQALVQCATPLGLKTVANYLEVWVAPWQYYDEQGKDRYILQEGESPYEGYYKCYEKGQLLQVGYFKNGLLIDGMRNYLSPQPEASPVGTVPNSSEWIVDRTEIYRNGKCIKVELNSFR